MLSIGDGKSLVDMLTRAWGWLQDRRDPIRGQAHRLFAAFEAFGIPRQQIPRVLPSTLQIQPFHLSNADKLRDRISPALLDWASEYLNLSRRWLDGVDPQPHLRVDGYKNENVYDKWFSERKGIAPDVRRTLFVWAAADPTNTAAVVPISLAYVEYGDWLDETELARYWLLSHEWSMSHAPCFISALRALELAQAHGIQTVGRVLPPSTLRALEGGRLFAPQANERSGKLWYPEDMQFLLRQSAA